MGDLAYNPLMWVGLILAAIFCLVGIVNARKAKKAKLAKLDKKQDEIDKRDKPTGGP
jgi:hypothetical protein